MGFCLFEGTRAERETEKGIKHQFGGTPIWTYAHMRWPLSVRR